MKPSVKNVVAEIVDLPRRVQILGDVSMLSLVEATGYFEVHDQICEADIRAVLVGSPQHIQEWLQYSEDKRTSTGWYVTENEEGCYETGLVHATGTRTNRLQYANPIDACASFIKRELEDIRLA